MTAQETLMLLTFWKYEHSFLFYRTTFEYSTFFNENLPIPNPACMMEIKFDPTLYAWEFLFTQLFSLRPQPWPEIMTGPLLWHFCIGMLEFCTFEYSGCKTSLLS